MSNRYKGGVISATPPTTTGGEDGTASGAWTLEQQMQLQAAGLWPAQPTGPYIEQVFSTYLYTGNGSTQTITNGIDLAGKGGMVWIKSRTSAAGHALWDTARTPYYYLVSNDTAAQQSVGSSNALTSYNADGFTVTGGSNAWNGSQNYASWTFRKQAKFFDIVTWTGDGSYPRTISHNLGSTPGCIIIKSVSDAGYGWITWHRSLGADDGLQLQTTGAAFNDANLWNGTPTSTTFSVGSYSGCNASGVTYVAYLYAHNAGGFGLTGTDNVISCGSYTGSSNTPQQITLGYEPQWVLLKKSSTTDSWRVFDNMRGMALSTGGNAILEPNTSSAESASSNWILPNATGFVAGSSATDSATYIYIAIRRGPMKVPTSGTSVFAPTTWTGTGAALQQNVGINYDSFMQWRRNGGYSTPWMDKLRGFGYSIYTQSTNAEVNQTAYIAGPKQNNYINFVDGTYNLSGEPWLNYAFVRAPSFFDEVCYLGTEVARTIPHNLGVAPELMIVKQRDGSGGNWRVYSATLGTGFFMNLNGDEPASSSAASTYWNNTTPTASVFSLGDAPSVNSGGYNYVAYLFATCAGVSKVGGYTGTGALQTINCGFTSGARFVLIKQTDTDTFGASGPWYVWDSARGITSGNDPYLLINSTAAEVTNTNYVDTDSTGFKVTAAAPAFLNASGGTYIFLAIA